MPSPSAALRKRLGYQRWLVARARTLGFARPIAVGPRLHRRLVLCTMSALGGPTLFELGTSAALLLGVPRKLVVASTDAPGSIVIRLASEPTRSSVDHVQQELQRQLPVTMVLRIEAHRAEGR